MAIASFVMAPPDLGVVDYAIHDPLPADADQTPVPTRAEVIQRALDEDRPREALRRANWSLVQKAAVVMALGLAILTGGLAPSTAAPPLPLIPTIGATGGHDYSRAVHSARPKLHAHGRHSSWSLGPRFVGHGGGSDQLSGGLANAIVVAERYLGGNPTGRAKLWCADFANMVERQLGRAGTNSREALSFLRYGTHVAEPAPGDLVVLGRHGGGHVGYLIRQTAAGPLIISGNHGHRVGIGVYPRNRVIAYVRPS